MALQPQLQFEKFPSTGGGFRVNTFEMVTEDASCDSDRPLMYQKLERTSVLSYKQFKPTIHDQSLATPAHDSYFYQSQRLSEPNKFSTGDQGMVLDQ
jgi:hypothetical protein